MAKYKLNPVTGNLDLISTTTDLDLTGYTKSATNRALTAADNVLVALGVLEKVIDDKDLTGYVALTGTQTISGNKTFSGIVNFSALTATYLLKLDGSKNVASHTITDSSLIGNFSGGGALENIPTVQEWINLPSIVAGVGTGIRGQKSYDDNYYYFCHQLNQWDYVLRARAGSGFNSLESLVLSSQAGKGYLGFLATTSGTIPTPASGFRLFADASGRLSWKGINGYTRTFDATSLTQSVVISIPNVSSGTMALVGAANIDFFHEAPTNQTIVLRYKAKRAGTIDNINIKTTSGTITANIRINNVSVTGLSALAVSSVDTAATATATNSFAVNDTIDVVLTSNSGAVNLQGSVQITPTT